MKPPLTRNVLLISCLCSSFNPYYNFNLHFSWGEVMLKRTQIESFFNLTLTIRTKGVNIIFVLC